MGKSKQKRFRVRPSPPTGLPSVKDFETELEATATESSTLQPIIEQVNGFQYKFSYIIDYTTKRS